MVDSPTTFNAPAAHPAVSWRALVLSSAASVVGMAVFLAGVLAVVNRVEWWRGYVAASIAAALAAGASLVPLVIGVRRGGALLVQLFMWSSAVRGVVALGVCALAVGVGRYPSLPTFVLVMPYYLALLGIETAILSRGLKR